MLRDAEIVVLDEPTSSMDARAESGTLARFRAFAAGRTTFLISHRLSSVRDADRILMVEGGKIVESGTHDELIARGGAYARLFNAQPPVAAQ